MGTMVALQLLLLKSWTLSFGSVKLGGVVSQRWCLLVSPLLPSLQLLVNSQDAGVSLVILTDQKATKVLPVELLKSYTHAHTVHTVQYSKARKW